ncbi:MAG: hypothetical protein P1P82_15530 [Bacteroidales bacterium]|nr:hypothetical protein [Bacteroidales bacterium]MDT8430722.1 hypothetical protein [Bacteroidales bacterium]
MKTTNKLKTTTKFIVILLSTIILSSCAKIFYTPDAYSLAREHKAMAILPPSVSIAAHKKLDAEAIIEQQKTESKNFQEEMYSWMLKRKMQGNIMPEIQDVETTNAILKKEGYPETPYTPGELCEILNVDGVMGSNFSLIKPMSEGAAVALGLLVGFYGATNEVTVSLDLRDCSNKKLIWNYSHKYSGGIGSSPSRLVDALMRHASKKMPYMQQVN